MNRNFQAATRIDRCNSCCARARAGRHCAGRASRARRNHGDRAQARRVAAGRSVCDQCAHGIAAVQRGREQHRGHLAQYRGPHRPEPRSRPEPGGTPRHFRRQDRPRPRRHQGAGRLLPGRVGDLAVAVYARSRPLRPQPRRGAARARRAPCSAPGRWPARFATSATSPTFPTATAAPRSASSRSTTAIRAATCARC